MKKRLLLTLLLTCVLWPVPFKAFGDPDAGLLAQRVQQNYARILSANGSYQRTFTSNGMKTDIINVKYTYQTGRRMLQLLKETDYQKADGDYEYVVHNGFSAKRPVVPDDLFYLPYLPLVTLAPTVVNAYNLNLTGSEMLSGGKAWLVEGWNKNQRNSNIHLVWKIDDATGVVLEVDIFDGGNHLAQVLTVDYYKMQGVFCPSHINLDNRGKLLHSHFVYDYSQPNLDVSSVVSLLQSGNGGTPPVEPLASPTLMPSPSSVSSLVQNVAAAPNVVRGNQDVRILFSLGQTATVKLTIFTLTGEAVYTTTASGTTGVNTLVWETKNMAREQVSSGLYIYVLQVNDGAIQATKTGKIVLLH